MPTMLKIADDVFPNNIRTVISLAALFDGEFSIDWLEEILQLKPSKILGALEAGVKEDLLACKSPGIYIFNHRKTRNEYRKQIYEKDREASHKKIARIFEEELPDTETKAFDIAGHLMNVKNDCWGCHWLFKAGMMHVNAFHIDEAAGCFNKVINDTINLKGEDADLLFIKAAVEFSNISTTGEGVGDILAHLKCAMEKAKKRNNEIYQALIEMHIARNKWLLNLDLNQALRDFQRGLSKAEKINAPELNASVTVFKTYFLFWQGLFREVIDVYEKSMTDIDRYPLGQFPTMAAITAARAYGMVGELTQGLGMLDSIREHCLNVDNLYMASRAASSIGAILLSINRVEDAIKYLKSSLKEAEKCKNHWILLISNSMLALAHYHNGERDQFLTYIQKFLKHSRISHVHQSIHTNLLEICWAVKEGDLPKIEGLSFEKVLRPQLSLENVYLKGIAHRYQSFLFKMKGHPVGECIQSLEGSIRFLEKSGNRIEIAKSQLELSRLYFELGDELKEQRHKKMAAEILEPINSDLIPDELKSFRTHSHIGDILLEEMAIIEAHACSKHDDKRFLRNIIISTNRIIGAERGAIFLVDFDDGETDFQLRASKNFTLDQMTNPDFAKTLEMMKAVINSGKGCITDVNSGKIKGASISGQIHSCLCAPIVLNGEPLGVMYHDNRLLSGVFQQSHLHIVSFFAMLVAFNLDRERAHQQIDKLNRKLISTTITENSFDSGTNFEGIIGKSSAIRRMVKQIQKVANTDAAVLILGETGVGKDLVARAIHNQSCRSKGAFVKVQCNALQESLIISELFGHEKGAFTGANKRRIGRFELADGGSFFLDEIGDLPLDVQVRLLNVLQTKSFERIGGSGKTLYSDFRFIAATNRNMEQRIAREQFREDLFYRINVFPIRVPPLRERKGDIPLLAEHFLSIYSARVEKRYLSIPAKELNKLTKYNWPGNIRELQNLIERSVILSNGPELRLVDFQPATTNVSRETDILPLSENERGHILKALYSTEWKIRGPGGAAELLDIHPSTLTSRIKKLGIERPDSMRKKS